MFISNFLNTLQVIHQKLT